MFTGTYFPLSYFAPTYWPGTGSTYPDLLTALVAYLLSESTVADLFTPGYGDGGYGRGPYGGQVAIHADEAPATATPPYLVVGNYAEPLPGRAVDDASVTLTVVVVTNSLDDARTFGTAVKAAIDSPNDNPRALERQPLRWQTGHEITALREGTRPYKLAGIGRGGRAAFVEEIEYTFLIDPD